MPLGSAPFALATDGAVRTLTLNRPAALNAFTSGLLAELREKRGLVYHAGCHVDRFEFGGQLAIEASFAARHLDAVLREVARLLRRQAEQVLHVAGKFNAQSADALQGQQGAQLPETFAVRPVARAAENRSSVEPQGVGAFEEAFARY